MAFAIVIFTLFPAAQIIYLQVALMNIGTAMGVAW